MQAPTSVPMIEPLPPHEARAADDDRRDGVEFVTGAGDRAADVQAQQIDHRGDARGEPADGERGDLVVARRMAGEPHRLLVGADGVDEPAEHGEAQDEPADQDDPDRDQENRRKHAEDDQVAEIDERLRKSGDGRVVARHARRAAGDVEHAERDDEGGHLPLLDDETVDEAAERADPHAAEERERNREHRPARSLSVMISAPTTVHSASTEPTERSMPPVRMTNVMPEASTVLIPICTNIFRKFSGVAKYGAVRREEYHDQDERHGDAGLAHSEAAERCSRPRRRACRREASGLRSRPYSS